MFGLSLGRTLGGVLTVDSSKLLTALGQWRDSLVNLTGRNRLLNYRPTRSSTIEFTRASPSEAYATIASPELTFVTGTRPPEKATTADSESSAALEELVLDEITSFDYEDYPHSLFADMTQRNVDRALKNMSGIAKREFLEKGLSTLYLALGALQWIDDAGDSRKSPLILMPATLDTLGPRQPLFLTLSADDISVNPALAIKLNEYGIELPSAETVIDTIHTSGLDAALAQFRSIDFPEGWAVNDFSTLSNFMFAKEAMYRDLLENEERILKHQTLQAVAGDVNPENESFAFDEIDLDEIDNSSPPEQTPLILDADASQRAAISAANAGKSFVMDGPPGTGKSQTIANMIGTLIAEGKTVLFVSEKIVALEVVRDRLSSRGLDPFSLELHSHKAVRSEVAKKLGIALQTKPVPPPKLAPERLQEARAARNELSDYAMAMNETRDPLGLSMFEVLGRLSAIDASLAPPPSTIAIESLNPGALIQLQSSLEFLQRYWNTALEGERALWSGLEVDNPSGFELQTALDALDRLQTLQPAISDVATALGLPNLHSIEQLHSVLESWHNRPKQANTRWLTSPELDQIGDAIAVYAALVNDLEAAETKAEYAGGAKWRLLPIVQTEIPESSDIWSNLRIDRSHLTLHRLASVREYLATANTLLEKLQENVHLLASQLGLEAPQTPNQYREFISATTALLGDTPPLVSWLTDDHVRSIAVEGASALKRITSEEAELEQNTAAIFTPNIVDLDVHELLNRLPTGASWLKRFSREYRRARATILQASQPTADRKSVIASLRVAVNWSDARKALSEATSMYLAALGPYFSGRETNWDVLALALENARTFDRSVRVVDDSSLTSALSHEASRKLLKPVHEELAVCFDTWTGLKTVDNESLIPVIAAGSLEATVEILATLAHETELLTGYLAEFSGHLGQEVILSAAMSAASARGAFAAADQALDNARPSLAGTLLVHPEDLPSNSGAVSEVESHLRWTCDFRAKLAGQPRHANSARAVTEEQLAALETSYLPGALGAEIADWEQCKSAVLSLFDERRTLELVDDFSTFLAASEILHEFVRDHDSATEWMRLQATLGELRELGVGAPLDYAIQTRIQESHIADYIMKSVYRTWFSAQMKSDTRLAHSSAIDRDRLIDRFRSVDRELSDAAIGAIVESATQRRPRSTVGQASIILREAEKKRKHIAVRELISRARDVIQSIHPCFMMSPLAVSQYLPADIEFDVVIFDEASQVSPADAINCIYRAKALVTVGDQKQLPPTSFFTNSDDIDEDNEDENLAADYESILDLMKATGNFNSLTLRWHYRSRHEDLISYSNASFYGGRLITFPGAIAESDRYGVKFHKVAGVYRRSTSRDNPLEAQYVAQRVLHHFETRPEASLGVVAFSSAQRDTIENAITLARADRPDLDGYFQENRVDGFFVKSLESVQGDERDVIIFSVGYGPDYTGKFYKQFGPVNRAGGQRRLNVAITRARELVELVSSISAADIGEVNNDGARHLRRYLDFAERGPSALELELGPSGLGTDSPFEDSVIDSIRSWGYEVQPQVGVAGYRIDIGVKHPNSPGAFMLGVECDGAMYHSSRAARDRDRLRHEILEGLGWSLHHIWGTAWYRNRSKEEKRLRDLLEQLALEPVTTRVTSRRIQQEPESIELAIEADKIDEVPSWVVEYREASPERIPSWLDLGDDGSHRHLADFVRAVVAAEAPVHIDLVAQRLRESSSIGRLGTRIQENLKMAIAMVDASFDGQFLRANVAGPVEVRSASATTERSIEQVSPEELSQAVLGVVKDARGISAEDAGGQVATIFGWRRRGSTIAGQLNTVINHLCENQQLLRTSAGLRIPDQLR